jgi:DNA-binding beta-propeller fold protein YncE
VIAYVPQLDRLLVPGGRTGNLYVVEPNTLNVALITGFTSSKYWDQRRGAGPIDAAFGGGYVFANDTGANTINVIDLAKGIVSSTPTAGFPDGVSYIASTNEVWVGEGRSNQVEIFSVTSATPPTLTRSGAIPFGSDPPEGVNVEDGSGRAYAGSEWPRAPQSDVAITVIDIASRSITARWPTGCLHGRDRHIDDQHGYLLQTCAEGSVSVLDVKADGRIVSHVDIHDAAGFDTTSYNPELRHWYLAGTACSVGNPLRRSCVVFLGVSDAGGLVELGRFRAPDVPSGPAASLAVAADKHAHVWITDPVGGRVWRLDDRFPATH